MQRFLLLSLFFFLFSNLSQAETQNKPVSAKTPKSTSTTTAKKTKKCFFPKSRKKAPDWVCSESDTSLAISAVGTRAKSNAGEAFMRDMATADARSKLATKIQEKLRQNSAEKNKSKSTNEAAIDRLTKTSIEGSKVLKTAYAPNGSLYVLVGIDEKNAQKLYEQAAEK